MDRRGSRDQRSARITLAAAVLLACAGFGRSTDAGERADGRENRNDDNYDRGRLAVCTHGCKFHSIQRAVDKARSGDTIDIGPGTYFENVVINGKDLILAGASADETTIDGNSQGPVFTLSQTTVTLTGMTVTHGSDENGGGVLAGGNVYPEYAYVEMTDVIVVSNVAAQSGGGIDLQFGTLKATRCLIAHNRASQGGGIYDQEENHLDLIDSTVARNDAELDGGGIYFEAMNTPTILRTTISDNASGRNGGGIWAHAGSIPSVPPAGVSLDHSAVVNNTAAQMGGGFFQFALRRPPVLVDGSIISLNSPDDVGFVYPQPNPPGP